VVGDNVRTQQDKRVVLQYRGGVLVLAALQKLFSNLSVVGCYCIAASCQV
jgi:hypothetical protein